MKPLIKVATLSALILTSSVFASQAQAAAPEKIGYVATAQIMAKIAQDDKINEKLRAEFKDQVAAVKAVEDKLKKGIEKLQRNGELMSESERTKLQQELQGLDQDLQAKVTKLREQERKRAAEEQRKIAQKLQKAIEALAKKEGYDIIIDRQAVLFASPADDLSDKVLKAVK